MRYASITGVMLAVVACFGLSLHAADAMRGPALRDVRLGGGPSAKMNAFFRERMQTEFAQREIFGEAREAFVQRDDDIKGNGGIWRGEFWGKLMLSTARVADYLQDPSLTKFVREECHRMIALQDPDGYLGSYRDPELVAITNLEAATKAYGWGTCWNLWNRKYAMWGMLMAYKATGDRAILDSVVRQADQMIAMMRRLGYRLHDTGATVMNGLPSMSLLKPLLMLYRETGRKEYLDYAVEMLPDWDRPDGACPNFFRNAGNGKPLNEWYPRPWSWAKAYEMMSCLDGLVEHHRVTGDRRSLETVIAIRDNILKTEANPFGGVGFGDKFICASKRVNALSEVCDAIHWIRLNLDLFLVTGDKRFLDAIETTYFNNFLAGVFRSGTYGAFFVRGSCRHENQYQCGYAYNHCCVDNVARTFMDMAEGSVTVDREGTYHVNFYQDAEVAFGDVRFAITGDYPKGNVITVKVSAPRIPKVEFRKPAWCPRLDIAETAPGTWRLTFDMNPRVVDRPVPDDDSEGFDGTTVGGWMRSRYLDGKRQSYDLLAHYRKTAAAEVMYGPLVLAKAKRLGVPEDEIFDGFTVNGKGYAVALKPIDPNRCWCAWELELRKEGERTVKTRVCDFQSAGDEPLSFNANAFSIWF